MNRMLEAMLQPGLEIKVFYNEGSRSNHTRHIRAIVDDEWVAYKTATSKGWRYHICHRYDFEYKFEMGRLS